MSAGELINTEISFLSVFITNCEAGREWNDIGKFRAKNQKKREIESCNEFLALNILCINDIVEDQTFLGASIKRKYKSSLCFEPSTIGFVYWHFMGEINRSGLKWLASTVFLFAPPLKTRFTFNMSTGKAAERQHSGRLGFWDIKLSPAYFSSFLPKINSISKQEVYQMIPVAHWQLKLILIPICH